MIAPRAAAGRTPLEVPGKRAPLAEDRLEFYRRVVQATIDYARRCHYAGYNKHDGLNSPILSALLGWSRATRLLAIQAVTRAPVNLRPGLLVQRTRNPKGLGLFAGALLDLYAAERREEDLAEARGLLAWLLEHPSPGFPGLGWGYPYPWQDVGFFAPRDFPNRVVTCWIGFAFVQAARLTGEPRYHEALADIARFLTGTPNVLCDEPEMKCYSYVPDESVTWAVMDVPALVGAFLAEAASLLGRREYADEARRLINWVVDKQTDYGAWYYAHPPATSHITHDNYHTAIILDCLDRYRCGTGDASFDPAYWAGLRFYRERLFTDRWAPRWMSDREYPYDIHGAASAILCFTRAAERDPSYWTAAEGVLDWTLAQMYDPRGFFYYQKGRLLTKKFCLLRWSNGWMSRALAAVISFLSGAAAAEPEHDER
jgi:hypothetical protein